jgi:hypothetical protein
MFSIQATKYTLQQVLSKLREPKQQKLVALAGGLHVWGGRRPGAQAEVHPL